MFLDALWRKLDEVRINPGWTLASESLREFWSLVFPTECVVCERPDSSLCLECAAALRSMTVRPFRAEAAAEGLPVRDGATPAHLQDYTDSLPLPVVASGSYAKSLAAVMLAFKNHGHTDVLRCLQAAYAGALHEARFSLCSQVDDVLLVPVPSKSASIRRRGYDPLSLLVSGLSRRNELPAGTAIVQAVRHPLVPRITTVFGAGGPAQKGLGRRGRRSNLSGSMVPAPALRELVRGRTCLVLDDVLTTGATIAETTRVLRGMGAVVAGAVVIAATPAPRGKDTEATAFDERALQPMNSRLPANPRKKTHR